MVQSLGEWLASAFAAAVHHKPTMERSIAQLEEEQPAVPHSEPQPAEEQPVGVEASVEEQEAPVDEEWVEEEEPVEEEPVEIRLLVEEELVVVPQSVQEEELETAQPAGEQPAESKTQPTANVEQTPPPSPRPPPSPLTPATPAAFKSLLRGVHPEVACMVKDTLINAGVDLDSSIIDYGEDAINLIEALIANELSDYKIAATLVIHRLREGIMRT